jgi:sigma-B regulation protein RsbU (phosphoserine phosphatase)
MESATAASMHRQLSDRRSRLLRAMEEGMQADGDLVDLLQRVDDALARLDAGEAARCLVCREPVDDEDARRNPLLEYCLCRLTPGQQRALEHDLGLARRIQAALLPDPWLRAAGWEAHYRYEPAGVVSGDYCDLWVAPGQEAIHFAVGDVSGKGVAASLLMAHLQAAFRSLVGAGVPLADLVGRVNRQLLEAGIPTHYATLACGRLDADGSVSLVNAGHCPPVVLRGRSLESLGPTGVPVGLIGDRPFEVHRFRLGAGEALFLHTDGLTEARGAGGDEYGSARLEAVLAGGDAADGPLPLLRRVRADLAGFLDGAAPTDDLTILAMRRSVA